MKTRERSEPGTGLTRQEGERIELALEIEAPDPPGDYVVELDLVLEGIGWFEEGGGSTLRLPLAVGKEDPPVAEPRAGGQVSSGS